MGHWGNPVSPAESVRGRGGREVAGKGGTQWYAETYGGTVLEEEMFCQMVKEKDGTLTSVRTISPYSPNGHPLFATTTWHGNPPDRFALVHFLGGKYSLKGTISWPRALTFPLDGGDSGKSQ